jgi:hypothetical protein
MNGAKMAENHAAGEHSLPQGGVQGSVHSFSCPTPGCDLHWERRLGYFKTATAVQTFQFGIGAKRCPRPDHFFLYLAELNLDTMITVVAEPTAISIVGTAVS